MNSEPKDIRFSIALSKSEMDEIDEWSWEQRIRSRSEAIRRLLRAGLDSKKAK